MKPLQCTHRKAVVLGAGGFIGINLVQALVDDGFDVVCFARAPSPHWPAAVQVVTGDFISPPAELFDHMNDAIVFHLVSSCKPSNATTNALREVQADVCGTIRCLEATTGRTVRWVFISSGGTVYGRTAVDRIREDHPTDPICTYGAAKLAIEKYFGIYASLHGFDHVIARLANPYGPWQYPGRGQGVVANVLHMAARGEEVAIWGDGEQVRDFLYVQDAALGVMSAAQRGLAGEVYNIGSGKGYSLNGLLCEIERLMPVKRRYFPARAIDVRRNVLDSSKIQEHTGWVPRDGMASGGLQATAAWLRGLELD